MAKALKKLICSHTTPSANLLRYGMQARAITFTKRTAEFMTFAEALSIVGMATNMSRWCYNER